MKNIVRIVFVLLLVMFTLSARVLAADSTNIVIDGNFQDWIGKPYVEDSKHDIKSPWLDFLGVGYYADDKYLYLHVIRQSAKKSEPWHFNVVMLNGTKGPTQPQYPFGSTKPVYAPQFDITTYYTSNSSHNGIVVKVSFNGQQLESTFSSDNSAKEIEFRVPLASVGLDGVNKEVKFVLKSDEKGVVDWAPESPITITTGPTLWQISSVFFFVIVSVAAYRVYKNKVSV
ncbi:hypothetical protein [Clostridium sp. OS1-26]|uniref:hypothetical protein n=1 Tax=Clostridium sp. OS1-26 TaxID=3070681 RepID=UPI0027E01090|nr:hypothetical protein [Clostridium sp. OS1-26]WML37501.1 hypothetical protein RCG18_13330 [Clostridium sp. OS1-26]